MAIGTQSKCATSRSKCSTTIRRPAPAFAPLAAAFVMAALVLHDSVAATALSSQHETESLERGDGTGRDEPAPADGGTSPAVDPTGEPAAEGGEKDREWQKRAVAGGVLAIVGIALIGGLLMILTILWGGSLRKRMRSELPSASPPDELWYLRKRLPGGPNAPAESGGAADSSNPAEGISGNSSGDAAGGDPLSDSDSDRASPP